MGRETLDQATFAGLHSVTKLLQVLTTLHAKSRGAIPWHSLRRGRLRHRRSPRQRIVGLSKGPWPHEQQHCSDEKRTSHVARHFDSSIALRHPRAASRRSNPLKETKLAAFNRWKRDQPARFRQRRLKSYDGSPHGTALRRFPRRGHADFDVIQRKLILELQTCSWCIDKPPMHRIYSPIDPQHVPLMEQAGRRDAILHQATPSIAPRPLCSEAFPTLNSLVQFCPNLDSFGAATWN
jgi:hypothetical protein